MLRRSKDDTINGIQILDLPPKTITVVKCDFSKQERRFYGTLQAKMMDVVTRIRETNDNRAYIHMLTMLLRLRQGNSLPFTRPRFSVNRKGLACDHPSLINGDWKADEGAVINQPENPTQEEDDDGKDLAKALGSLNLAAAPSCQLCFAE